jgi:hypothetical protein
VRTFPSRPSRQTSKLNARRSSAFCVLSFVLVVPGADARREYSSSGCQICSDGRSLYGPPREPGADLRAFPAARRISAVSCVPS